MVKPRAGVDHMTAAGAHDSRGNDAARGAESRPPLLRASGGHDRSRVTIIELFFDLVFVFAVTQLSHALLARLDAVGAMQIALLLIAVWWVWIFTSWVTNWLDPERMAVRVCLLALMLAGRRPNHVAETSPART
jgi:low temperature requirement protein LtrA